MTQDLQDLQVSGAACHFLRHLFDEAVRAADPRQFLPQRLPEILPEWFDPQKSPGPGRLVIVGAGKAAGSMAQAVEAALPEGRSVSGLVVTRYGYALPCEKIEVIEAAHPVPDSAGLQAAQRVMACVQGLTEQDTVLALISGGASALLAAPRPGLDLSEKREITRALLTSGASIHEINCVRKHLSMIKGGQLAALCAPARVVTLALSDVTGDDPAVIGSGPTVSDPSTCAEALSILDRYQVAVPLRVREALNGGEWETPKGTNFGFRRSQFHLVGSAQFVLQKICDKATFSGVTPLFLGDAIEGEAREVARVMAGIVRSCQRYGTPAKPPCLILSGGETSVTLKGKGRGGRNAEFLLAFAIALRGAPRVYALAADTDGIDGTEDNAGALYWPEMLASSLATENGAMTLQGARQRLENNDAYTWFAAQGGLVLSGPTFTNINDFRAILVLPEGKTVPEIPDS